MLYDMDGKVWSPGFGLLGLVSSVWSPGLLVSWSPSLLDLVSFVERPNADSMFHAVDGVLYLDNQCLMQPVPEEVTADDIRHSTCRMFAESMDYALSIDKRYMMRRACGLGSLSAAISILLGAGGTIELMQRKSGDPLFCSEHDTRFDVYSEWSLRSMVIPNLVLERAEALESALRIYDSPVVDVNAASHTYVVTGICLPSVVIPLLQWSFITKHNHHACRFSLCEDDRDNEGLLRVLWYRNGLLVSTETVDGVTICRDWTIYIDVHSLCDTIPDGPAHLDHFARVFLRSDRAVELARSDSIRALLSILHPWKPLLKTMWYIEDDQHMIDMLCKGDSPDALVNLVNVRDVLYATAYTCKDLDLMGLAVLRRMRPVACSRVAEWRATAISEHSIVRFKMLPTDANRFRHLFHIGALESISEHDEHVSAYGFLMGTGIERTVTVPFDADARLLTMALVQMLPYEIDVPATPPSTIVLSFGILHCEWGGGCFPNEAVRAYRIGVDKDSGVTLTLDYECDGFFANDSVTAVDMMQKDTVARCETRVSKATLTDVFPKLSQRIQVGKDPITACMREVQSRRVCGEWMLEGIDEGSNLSSLGMSVTMALVLNLWIGAQVRVFIGLTRAAMLGYWNAHSARYELIDPTRTVLNGFDVAPHFLRTTSCEVRFDIKRQSFLEVRQRTTWHVAIVVTIDKALQTVQVRFLLSGTTMTLCLRQHAWRRLARNEDTDIDKVLRKYISTAAAGGASPHSADSKRMRTDNAS